MLSLESPRWGDSNDNTQHTFMLKKIENNPYCATWPGTMINTLSSNFPCLEHIFMVPNVFEPLNIYCTFKHFVFVKSKLLKIVVIVALRSCKELRSCQDCQLTKAHYSWAGLDLISGYSNWQLSILNQRKEKVRRDTDCATRPGNFKKASYLQYIDELDIIV